MDYLTIRIDPSAGEDTPDCLTGTHPCGNITWVLQQPHSSSTHYLLSEGTHYLTSPTPPFQHLSFLAFTGNSSVVTCTQSDTGLAFIDVAIITFHNVSFQNCSAIRNSTSKNFRSDSIFKIRVGLYFYLCENISMSYVNVSHSPNATGVVVYDTNGTNTFTDSSFSHNILLGGGAADYPGGGGFYVEFTYCQPGMLCQHPPSNDHSERNRGASYTFRRCEFAHNRADNMDTSDSKTYLVPHGSDHQAIGHGGGLSLFVKGSTSEVTFAVIDCVFYQNVAIWGGGFFVELHDSVHSNNISVDSTRFSSNECLYSTSEGTEGGGMKVGHYIYGLDNDPIPKSAARNQITVSYCQFTENSALHGGGLSISLAFQTAERADQLGSMHLQGNDFENNTAKLGAAVNLDRFGGVLKGSLSPVVIEDSTFRYNTIEYAHYINQSRTPHQVGIGAVHINEVPVWFRGNVTFQHNWGSALSAIAAVVNFTSCVARFTNNTGDSGGAIALLGAAYMQISNGTWMGFDFNTATTVGGAIYNTYISRENLKSDSDCFIRHTDPFLQPDDWEAKLIFSNNHDRGGTHPNAIHSTSILPCSVPGGSGTTNQTEGIFCWKGWIYSGRLVGCEARVTSDIGILTLTEGERIGAYSGWRFEVPVLLEDDLHNEISGTTFSVTYNDTNDVNFFRKDSLVVNGEPDLPVDLSIETLGNRIWHFKLTVDLEPCPAGFKLSNNTNISMAQCECSGSYGGAILCDETSKTIKLLDGMWLGRLENDTSAPYVVMDCPLHYCERTTKSRYLSMTYQTLPMEEAEWDALICGRTNRTGVNCGQCIPGFGPAINSLNYECINCTGINRAANIAAYVASVYLPLATLFAILIVFDIRLTTGPANAFILYCQVVTSTFDLNADGGIPSVNQADKVLSKAYRLPFGIFNLKFIENYIPAICFSPDFNSMSIFVLDYAVAFFPLVMILVVIVCLKISESCCLKNRRLGTEHRRRLLSISRLASVLSARNKKKKINDALLPAFASFLLLSYNKFSTISSYILNDQHPIMESGHQMPTPRVYYASQLEYTETAYLAYFIPAVVVFGTIVTFTPLVLLDYPLKALEWCISRVDCLRRIYPNDKVHLFLNMFQGCYRPRMRFFAGLYFLFRFVINLSYVLTDTWLQQFLVQQAATTIMIAMLAVFHPYEWALLNYVDILIFMNMALLNSISFYLYSFSKIDPLLDPSPSAVAIQYSLVFLPLIYMISYVVWNVSRPHHPKIRAAIERWRSPKGYEPLATTPTSTSESELQDSVKILGRPPRRSFVDKREFEDDFEAMMSRAEDRNTYMPSLSKSVTVVEVSGDHTEGEAHAFLTTVAEDSDSHQPHPGDAYGATGNRTTIN